VQSAVTPEGVRAGESGALAALCERRGAAVLAYCREVCDPAYAALAAAEALARFRAAVWTAGDAGDLDPERLLLSATRHAAADRAQVSPEASTTRRFLGRGQTMTCARMPGLIVARAENLLGSADLDRLSRHVERCSTCRATEAAFRRAERAYVATSHAAIDSSTTALFLGALAEAAPVAVAAEVAPDAPAPEPEAAEAEPLAAAPEPEPDPLPVEPAAPEPEPLPTPAAPEPAALAFPPTEPLAVEPAAEQLPDELDDADEDGWAEDDRYEHMLEPGPATWNATEPAPRKHSRLRIVLPVAVLAAGAAVALAVAGVFDDGDNPSATTTRTTPAAPAHTTTTRAHHHKRTNTHPTTVTATP
jgi:hypothetical protein